MPLVILVVEDEPRNRRLVVELLSARGHQVLEAADVQGARDALARATPDVVATDVLIPGGGGEAVLALVRASTTLSRVPVVAVTALATNEDRARILVSGFDGHIAKPLNCATFASELESYMRRRPESTAAGCASGPDADARRPVVLVVDDERANRSMLRGSLEADYTILEAADGRAALELLEREPVDGVLLDVMMPGLSGYQTCLEIKRRFKDTFLPVLFLTALDDQLSRNEGLASGGDDFLTKPVDRLELSLRLKAFLRLRSAESALRAQAARLEHLGQLKDDLVSLLVHDMRSPLQSVLGYLSLLEGELGDVERRDLMAPIVRSAQRLKGALEDMLRVRQMEEGRLVPVLEATAPQAVAIDAIQTVLGMTENTGVEVRCAGIANGCCRLDRQLVGRALENLLSNAVRYSPGGSAVELGVTATDDTVTFVVADRGPGIPEPVAKRLFEKFGTEERADGAPRRGFGLGLYMVRLTAQAHGGRVWAQARPGGGTVFHLELPRNGTPIRPVGAS